MATVERNATAKDNTFPQETVMEGNDLSSYWKALQNARNQVDQESYEYRPISQNSNSFADEVLRRAGLPAPTETGDDGNAYPSPGSDTH